MTITSGLVGGLLGAIVTGAVVVATDDDPSPSAVVWAMYLGDGDPEHYETQGAALHLIYGALAGAVFVALAGAFSLGLATFGGALLWAIVWSAALVIVAAGFWMVVVIGDRPDARIVGVMVGVHLAFGIVLGLWIYYVPSF